MKIDYCVFGGRFTRANRKELGLSPDYNRSAELARQLIIAHRMKLLVTIIMFLAVAISAYIATNVNPPATIFWFSAMVCFSILGSTGIKTLKEDWASRPGKSSYTLYRAWRKFKPELKKFKKLMEEMLTSKEDELTPENQVEIVLQRLARQVREHEVEGRGSSRKRVREQISWIVEVCQKIGMEVDVKSAFQKQQIS